MENNNNKSGGNFFSGFLLGALVGAAIVFLFGTKKGKRLLKAISEEGAGNISNLLEKVERSVDLDEISGDEPSFAEASTDAKAMVDKPEGRGESLNPVERVKPKIKRFFRGISRHAN